MDKVDPNVALELARQALGLPQTEDKEALRSVITFTIEAMNPLDRAAFRMKIGRLFSEATSDVKLTPGFHVIGCLFTALIPVCLSLLVSRLIAMPHLGLVLKVPLALADLVLIFVSFASARVLSRAITQARQSR